MVQGQIPRRALIAGITNSFPCSLETVEAHGYSSLQFVRLTDLNGVMPIPRGEDPLNDHRFRIIVTGSTTFNLQDPVTHKYIDSTNYTPYVEGGNCNLIAQEFVYHGEEE